ncbi:MAG: META domain-containing protein [Acidimicrobiia bacterium]|nr:META domain-containing protein [Acidimicrobiia bacterium]
MTLSACSGADRALIEGLWLLDSVAVDGVFLPLEQGLPFQTETGSAVWVDFARGGVMRGQGPCNDFTGRYEFDGMTLVPDEVTASAVVCASEIPAIEEWMAVEDVVLEPMWSGADVHFSSDIRMQWQTDHVTLTFRRQT